VATASAMAATKTLGEGAAATLVPTALARMGAGNCVADNNQPKSGRGKDIGRGVVARLMPTALTTTGVGDGRGKH
jgi:hypothetical protein